MSDRSVQNYSPGARAVIRWDESRGQLIRAKLSAHAASPGGRQSYRDRHRASDLRDIRTMIGSLYMSPSRPTIPSTRKATSSVHVRWHGRVSLAV